MGNGAYDDTFLELQYTYCYMYLYGTPCLTVDCNIMVDHNWLCFGKYKFLKSLAFYVFIICTLYKRESTSVNYKSLSVEIPLEFIFFQWNLAYLNNNNNVLKPTLWRHCHGQKIINSHFPVKDAMNSKLIKDIFVTRHCHFVDNQ